MIKGERNKTEEIDRRKSKKDNGRRKRK